MQLGNGRRRILLGLNMEWLKFGFLSDSMREYEDIIFPNHKSAFELAEEINCAAMELMPGISASGERELASAAFFARAMQSHQAALLLLRRGMIADARNIARSLVETAIALGGLAFHPKMLKMLAADSNNHYKTLTNILLNDPTLKEDMPDEDRIQLRSLLKEAEGFMEKPTRLRLDILANEIGLSKLYNFAYRPLSGDAAHPTLDALRRHIKSSDCGKTSLVFSPQESDLPETMSFAISGILTCLEAISEVFNRPDIMKVVDEQTLKQERIFIKAHRHSI